MKEENLRQAQSELDSLNAVKTPQSLEDVIAGLQGFGIEEFEEVLTVRSANKTMWVRFSNICTDDEMVALMAVEGMKGYAWTQRIKCEILSRAISWIAFGEKGAGVNLRSLTPIQRMTVDPKDGQQKDIQVVLRNLIIGWGEELVRILWKVYMVHVQQIEDRLSGAFPESALTTEVERRFLAAALKEIEDGTKEHIRETVAEIFKEEGVAEEPPAPAAEVKQPA